MGALAILPTRPASGHLSVRIVKKNRNTVPKEANLAQHEVSLGNSRIVSAAPKPPVPPPVLL
jgi:hypothetical protein